MSTLKTPEAIRGTQDIFGADAEAFAHVAETFERIRKLYRFRRIEMPVFEKTAVFSRSLGETTDVVSKEMYSFDDRGRESLTLRPEFTAGIARAFLTNGWQQHAPVRLATHGPLFRYERPQKGRYRQFHQLDAEIIGAAEPQADVELLVMADQLLKELGVADDVTLQLNTLGDASSRDAWRTVLVEYFMAHRDSLSEDSQERLERNPLRILDSKDPRDKELTRDAPQIDDYLSGEAQDFFGKVTQGLDAASVEYVRTPTLVRGLDYYRHTAFEFVPEPDSPAAKKMGSQSTLLGGGRYDGLIETLGGSPTPAVGWAAGIERLAMLVGDQAADPVDAAIVPIGDEAMTRAQSIAAELRRAHYTVEVFASGKLKKRMSRANEAGALAALIIGEDEIASGTVQFKDLLSGEQQALKPDEVLEPLMELTTARAMKDLESEVADLARLIDEDS
ncbi:MAG: histidine--tRNA ligase [Novosphingobium sp.]|nr:histidine--tRNA ligase [Novosphingobium sp.]